MIDLAAVLITVDRSPVQNYLASTLENLTRDNIFESPVVKFPRVSCPIFVSDSGPEKSSGKWAASIAESLGLRDHVCVNSFVERVCANLNVANALRVGAGFGAQFVVFMEDDIDVCADFFGSVSRWLTDHARSDIPIYPLGCAYPYVLRAMKRGLRAVEYPVSAFYGTQALALRSEDALNLSEYLTAHCYDRNPDGTCYDLIMHDWVEERYPKCGSLLTPCPSFVQHTGRTSIINPRPWTHSFASFPGRNWTYGDPVQPLTNQVSSRSSRVRAADFDTAWLTARLDELLQPHRLHRKHWEYAVIAECFLERFGTEHRAIGFGVGAEPIPAWLAAQGAKVLATDKPAAEAAQWAASAQHAAEKGAMPFWSICTARQYETIDYRAVDMRSIPEDLLRGEYDFLWSCSSAEHLGGIEAGLDFLCRSTACLRPGGLAVHTTEWNYASEVETLEAGDLCLFREQDLVRLGELLRAQGDRLMTLDLAAGTKPEDAVVDVYPYQGIPHLSIGINGQHVTTSVVLVIEKGGADRQVREENKQ